MRHHGIRAITARRFRTCTTDSRHDWPIAPNRLNQNFAADRPNQVWLADITYVPTSEGWLYLAVVLDLFTRKIVGWAMRDHMRAELTIAALTMAIQRQKPPPGLNHHSDRGSQYAATDYRKVLDGAAMIQSMSRKGNCWDDAPKSKPNSCTTLAIQPGKLPGMTCSLTSKDITIVSGYIPPSGISLPNRQSAKPLDPVSTKSGEGQLRRSAESDDLERNSCSFHHRLHSRTRAVARSIVRIHSSTRGCPGIGVRNIDRPEWRWLGYEPWRHRSSRRIGGIVMSGPPIIAVGA